MNTKLGRLVRWTLLAATGGALFTGCIDLIGGVSVQGGDAGAIDDPSLSQTACPAGAMRCQGPVLQACETDGSGWAARERCASASLCSATPSNPGRCIEPSCAPGITCADAVLRECNADRTGFVALETCASAAHCDAAFGACRETPCSASSLSCNGATLERCNADSSGREAIAACDTAALCNDGLRDGCGDGPDDCDLGPSPCPAAGCEPGELRCSGARLETCNVGRNGWDRVDECVTEAVCEQTLADPGALGCAEALCNEGDVLCSPDGERLACNAARTAYSDSIGQCRSADACSEAGCLADTLCLPGALSCNGLTLLQCRLGPGALPRRVPVDDCATRALCALATSPGTSNLLAPLCVDPVCAPGEHRCDGAQMQVCNADRTGFDDARLCASAALCEAGAGLGECPVPCSGATCNGSMLRLCNTERTGFVDAQDCGSPAACDSVSGACTGACTAGELRCNGDGLERCQGAPGWRRLATCESPGLCAASVQQGLAACAPRRCSAGEHRCSGRSLEVCNDELTGFVLEQTCLLGQSCDAPNGQCDNCAAGAVACIGNAFTRCSDNGQIASVQLCGNGLCTSIGSSLGCLQCATPNGYRCDGSSLLLCSADQRSEAQIAVCDSPQACRADLGRCAGCAVPGRSRCDGDRVMSCQQDGTEALSESCAPGACQDDGTTAACALCRPNERRCSGSALQACTLDGSAFETTQICGDGLECIQEGTTDARCGCVPTGAPTCVGGQLTLCSALGAPAPIGADHFCDGNQRLTCSASGLSRSPCASRAQCEAGTGSACAECVDGADCPTDGRACNGSESCVAGSCRSSGDPCLPGQGPCTETLDPPGFACSETP